MHTPHHTIQYISSESKHKYTWHMYLYAFILCVFLESVFFSSNLLNMFSEIHYWDRLKYEIPQRVSDISQDREDLRGVSEKALLLVKNYKRSDFNMHTHTDIRKKGRTNKTDFLYQGPIVIRG